VMVRADVAYLSLAWMFRDDLHTDNRQAFIRPVSVALTETDILKGLQTLRNIEATRISNFEQNGDIQLAGILHWK
jgi:hypothetical protein